MVRILTLTALMLSFTSHTSAEYIQVMLGDGFRLLLTETCPHGEEATLVHWLTGKVSRRVAVRSEGIWKPEKTYEDRIVPSSSLVFNRTTYNDNGVYELTCGADKVLSFHQLKVVPPSEASVSVGQRVKLQCHPQTAGGTLGLLRWERNGELVLELDLTTGKIRHGPMFEGRVSVYGYEDGDLSLILERAKLEDQGGFFCYYGTGKETHSGIPEAVRLTVIRNWNRTINLTTYEPPTQEVPMPVWKQVTIAVMVTAVVLISVSVCLVDPWLKRCRSNISPGSSSGGSSRTDVELGLLNRDRNREAPPNLHQMAAKSNFEVIS
ncbi:hypothetical protein LDENG_00253000 [Lucifuga dentata]|nr:hypothetical protein LDENG_00253000 [Lucifuga dentata]